MKKAAENGFLNTCHLIILYTNDKNPENLMGITPLYVAALKGHISICQLIIENIQYALTGFLSRVIS